MNKFYVITKKEAKRKALAITSEGMHFKGQFLPKESFEILGKEIDILDEAFKHVSRVRHKDKEYFISNILWEEKN